MVVPGMADVSELRCTNCYAPLRPEAARGGVVTCEYCGTTLKLPGAAGGLLLDANFRDPALPGWTTTLRPQLELLPGPPPELLARLEANQNSWNVLRSSATFDDFDVSVTVRLLWGDLTTTRAGLFLRYGPQGLYTVWVSTQGTFSVGYVGLNGAPGKTLVGWARHAALRTQPGEPNVIRASFAGDRLRVQINGAPAASLRDASSGFGAIYLAAHSSVPMAVAYSALEVREPERAAEPAAPPPTTVHAGIVVDVVLVAISPDKKIPLIKAVREATGLGLKEAKDLVESTPQTIKSGQLRSIADDLKRALEGAGGKVELRPPAR